MKNRTSLSDFSEERSGELLPELKNTDQWMCWYYKSDKSGKFRKKPFPGPSTETLYEQGVAKYSDSRNWLTYTEALSLDRRKDQTDGIGFVLDKRDDFVVLDIDNCITTSTNGVPNSLKKLLADANSYAERSPSGEGVHILLKGDIPQQGWTEEREDFRIEIYDNFFITVTEDHIQGTSRKALSRQDFLDRLFQNHTISWPDPKFTSYWPE
ncbi:MAG: hypothetical protein ABEH81_14030 [Halopenitus sp.]